MTHKNFTIGTLAKKAGVNVETIRFYQRRGLLVQPVKPFNGVRHYTEDDVLRVRFIKQGQKIGFSLDEILELLSLEDGQHCREAKETALRKLTLIRERLESLHTMETALSNLVKTCASTTEPVSCPIILALLGTTT
jgi:MerR family transcriptional regulator, mercuric resistance operon regulatory protein